MARTIPTVNLFNEPFGLSILISPLGDVLERDSDFDPAAVKIVGHHVYCTTLDSARQSIVREYLRRPVSRQLTPEAHFFARY